MTATTALTAHRTPIAQNAIPTPSRFVEMQINAACEHNDVDIAKIGNSLFWSIRWAVDIYNVKVGLGLKKWSTLSPMRSTDKILQPLYWTW